MRDSDPNTQTLGHGASQKETRGREERKFIIFYFVFSSPPQLSPSSALVTNWLHCEVLFLLSQIFLCHKIRCCTRTCHSLGNMPMVW